MVIAPPPQTLTMRKCVFYPGTGHNAGRRQTTSDRAKHFSPTLVFFDANAATSAAAGSFLEYKKHASYCILPVKVRVGQSRFSEFFRFAALGCPTELTEYDVL